VRSATTGSTAMGVRTASAAARVATWSVEVAIVVITVIGVTLEIADVKAQAEDPVHDREKCGEEGANMWKMVISCKVTNQERQGVLELQHVAILSPMAAAAKEMPALLQVISQPIGEGVEGRSNANQIPLVKVSAGTRAQDRVALPCILRVLAVLCVVGWLADDSLGHEQEETEKVFKDGNQLRVDRRHVAEVSEAVEIGRERRIVAVIAAASAARATATASWAAAGTARALVTRTLAAHGFR
jgi:hypothetical protein